MNRYQILYHSGSWDGDGSGYAKEEIATVDAPTATDALVMFAVEHPLSTHPSQGAQAFNGAERIVCIREDLQIVLNLRGGQERVRE